jgi:hypothetical protein
LRLRLYVYNDYDNLDHGYIMISYLDIDIKKRTLYKATQELQSTASALSLASTPLPHI